MSYYSKVWAVAVAAAVGGLVMRNWCVTHTWLATSFLVLVIERTAKHDPRKGAA